MKLIYFSLFWAFTLVASAQDSGDIVDYNNSQTHKFKLYPNPAFGDIVYITTSENGSKEITVYDVFGKAVLRERLRNNALDISPLIPGVYVLQLRQNNKTMTRKLVVK
ncbi:T9SS type A sorting domain-containing protein [Poritiphilus flavus]|uniref:T9SS type A sorting domain-containing protein n=1 Tax=Poritiphilus flavus TaxID=2697053 RepID=A0A6L9EDE6_9FLAO|nr:T9SS type A sorting domain-containing protein [Poritiphilus flavus]NAS12716.1 T9SS type A sorting domain-containing protein [Poritiphilus flavus]